MSTAEFILPVLIVFLLTFIEWRNIWISISILTLIFLPLATFILVKKLDLIPEKQVQDDERKKKLNNGKELKF